MEITRLKKGGKRRDEGVIKVARQRRERRAKEDERRKRSAVAGSAARGNFNNPRDTKRNVCSHIWPGLMRQFSVYVGPSARGRKITIAGKRLREEAGGKGAARIRGWKGTEAAGRGKETDGWKEGAHENRGKNRRNGWRETEIYIYIYVYARMNRERWKERKKRERGREKGRRVRGGWRGKESG